MADFTSRLHSLLSSDEAYSNLLLLPQNSEDFLRRSEFAETFVEWIRREFIDSPTIPQPPRKDYLLAASKKPIEGNAPRKDYLLAASKKHIEGNAVAVSVPKSSSVMGALERRLGEPSLPASYSNAKVNPQTSNSSSRSTEKRRITVHAVPHVKGVSGDAIASVESPKGGIAFFPVQAGRIGDLLAELILNKVCPLSRGLRLLVKLLSSSSHIPNRVLNQGDTTRMLHAALDKLDPLLLALGSKFLTKFLQLEFIRKYRLDFIEQAKQVISESSPDLVGIESTQPPDESFIRTFAEDVDNRNDYRSPVDARAYNERERCYDSLSNLIRRFQQADIEGGAAISRFWKNMAFECPTILDIMPCNSDWFCSLFVDILLFYCASNHLNTVQACGENHPVPLPRSTIKEVQTTMNILNTANKNPGSARKSAYDRKSSVGIDIFNEPAKIFHGNQQFFFRFIVLSNNYLFGRNLELELQQRIFRLVEHLSDDGTEDSSSFPDMVLRLKVLGRFYGVVLFYSQWTLPLSDHQGPIALQLQNNSFRKQALFARSVPLDTALKDAASKGTLSLAVPWVVESFKMLKYNIFWSDCLSYLSVLRHLYVILFSPQFSMKGVYLSSRRYHSLNVYRLLLSFFIEFSLSMKFSISCRNFL